MSAVTDQIVFGYSMTFALVTLFAQSILRVTADILSSSGEVCA
ncbi:hypothetical protein [Pseudomonas viridiflava]|nr:hypothetical protein [Pseudomonas viridiflava]MEE3914690.1 hypothetical protein [Pseudomonas viridiflava]MEE4018530.1 hypothetical protein [Pseudomonas viridiflava]MEE4045064.1 hypothetical protein [Pseudomonas viridiflava]